MGRPSWSDDDRFGTVAGRQAQADEIDRRLQDWFAGQGLSRAVERPCRRGHSRRTGGVAVAGDRERAAARPRVLRNPRPSEHRFGPLPAVRRSPRSAVSDRWLMRPPPTLGEHNGEVLRDRCGLTDEELDTPGDRPG